MEIVDIILFALTTIGLTQLVVESNLFEPLRQGIHYLLVVKLVEFFQKRVGIKSDKLKSFMEYVYSVFECHQCAGTWCGFLCGYVFLEGSWFQILLYGAAGGFLAKSVALYLIYLEAKSVVDLGDDYE